MERGPGTLPRTVLVADDEAPLRELLAEYLAARGCEVLQAGNGLEVLLQVKHARPGAILLDLTMPRLGGLEALKRIHAFDPAIRVVILTGETDAALHRKALAGGASAVLVKPVDFTRLLAALSGGAVPAPEPPAPVTAGPATPGGAGAPRPASARVLVVDDDRELSAVLEEFLRRQGYEARSVADGGGALRAIVAEPPDVVLLDIALPGLPGTAALPAIQAVAPQAAVIMMSAVADEELARRTLADGAFDYVVKPVDLPYLAQSLEAAIAMKTV